MRWISVPLFGLAVLAGIVCPAAEADSSAGEPKEIQAARKLSLTKCAKCHKFYNPADYSRADWEMWMAKMGKKSKLKPQQFETISRYLDGLRVTAKPTEKK